MKLFLLFLFGSRSGEVVGEAESGEVPNTDSVLQSVHWRLCQKLYVDQFLLSFILFFLLGLEGEQKLQVVEPSLKV